VPNAADVGARLRELRQRRRLSLRALAAEVGFTPGFLSQVELGQASPSIASLERIAAALGVTLGQFFQEPERATPAIVRAGERPELRSDWSQARVALLSPPGAAGGEALLITLEPGGRSGSRAAGGQPGEAFALVQAGMLAFTLGETEAVLAAGDAVTYRLETPHRWANPGDVPATLLLVSWRPRPT